jgi:hypothetical protein
MADQERNNGGSYDYLRTSDNVGETNKYQPADYLEETSAEIAAPATFNQGSTTNAGKTNIGETMKSGTGIGFAALIISILSLFVAPILFGAVGIVLGFIARRRGATGLGSWAIGIGAISIIVGMFILPFF